jgi:DNA-binding transcriptional regulator YiaG
MKMNFQNAKSSSWLVSSLTKEQVKKLELIHEISMAIVRERKKLGMNQTEFAKFLGVTQGMVSKWESGEYNFTLENISNIFVKLNLDVNINVRKQLSRLDDKTRVRKSINNWDKYNKNIGKYSYISEDLKVKAS